MADAHIWPKALVRDLVADPGKEPIYSIPASPREREKPRRTGVKDNSILCRACEARFMAYDQFGIDFLRRPSPPIAGDPIVLSAERVDSNRLKLFLLFALWRSHESLHPDYAGCKLGPGPAERLRRMLIQESAGCEADFATLIVAVPPDPAEMHAFSTPFRRCRWKSGATFYYMQHERWLLFVTPSPQLPPLELRPFLVGTQGKVPVIFGGHFRETAGFQAMVAAVHQRKKAWPSWPGRSRA